jgi:Guanylate-binding protein, C-terminal domain
VTGPMLLDLAFSYVEALNTGSVPTIESAWDSVQLAEIDRSYREALAHFEK